MSKFPQQMINVRVAKKSDPLAHAGISKAVDAATQKLNGRGRVLLRPSGTEPVIRVMVEGEDGPLVEALTQELADTVKAALA
jgi:phosphoglucosamine mutase